MRIRKNLGRIENFSNFSKLWVLTCHDCSAPDLAHLDTAVTTLPSQGGGVRHSTTLWALTSLRVGAPLLSLHPHPAPQEPVQWILLDYHPSSPCIPPSHHRQRPLSPGSGRGFAWILLISSTSPHAVEIAVSEEQLTFTQSHTHVVKKSETQMKRGRK